MKAVRELGAPFIITALLAIILHLKISQCCPSGNEVTGIFRVIINNSHMVTDWLFLQHEAVGEDGYNHIVLESKLGEYGLEGYYPRPRYSPPWYYLFFGPFAFMPPVTFAILAAVLAIVASVVTVHKCFSAFRVVDPPLYLLAPVLFLYPPLVENIYAGQVSAFIALIMVMAFLKIQKGEDYVGGFYLALLTAKPQSVYLVIAALLTLSIVQKRYNILYGFLWSLLFLAGATWIANPELFTGWMAVQPPEEYKTLTIATEIRAILFQATGHLYRWPVLAVSTAAYLVVLILINLRKLTFESNLLALLPAISCLTAPYGWFYDLTCMVPTVCFVFLEALKKYRNAQTMTLYLLTLCSVSGSTLLFIDVSHIIFLAFPLFITSLMFMLVK